jgi:hypothetical protein
MKAFVLSRYGRGIFSSNVFPSLDFSTFDTPGQLEEVVRRHFAPRRQLARTCWSARKLVALPGAVRARVGVLGRDSAPLHRRLRGRSGVRQRAEFFHDPARAA